MGCHNASAQRQEQKNNAYTLLLVVFEVNTNSAKLFTHLHLNVVFSAVTKVLSLLMNQVFLIYLRSPVQLCLCSVNKIVSLVWV